MTEMLKAAKAAKLEISRLTPIEKNRALEPRFTERRQRPISHPKDYFRNVLQSDFIAK